MIERILEEAQYIVDTHASLKQTATKFGVSEKVIQKDIIELYNYSYVLYWQVHRLIDLGIIC